jgi:hypothetical protein
LGKPALAERWFLMACATWRFFRLVLFLVEESLKANSLFQGRLNRQ